MEPIAQVRGRGAMTALEFVKDPSSLAPDAGGAKAIVAEGNERRLISLVCGTSFNVVRLLPPPTTPEELLLKGLDILDASIQRPLSQAPAA
jgi:4-aminobutyrate aminotransferase-like enzyme